MSASEIVLTERRDSVALVTLNRPQAMNAINLEMRRVLADTMRELESDRAVRAIVFKGAGDRAFCAGADIKEFRAADSLPTARKLREPPSWNDLIAASSKPTIAAIQGICLGGGLEIALACDIRIAAPTAVFGLPEVRLAIIPGAGGTQRLPRVVGLGHALRMILTGDQVSSAEALRIGLVSELVPAEDLLIRALAIAGRIVTAGPLAIAYAKEAVRRGTEMPIADGLRLEADLATFLTNTADRIEGATAFRERRQPVYRGE